MRIATNMLYTIIKFLGVLLFVLVAFAHSFFVVVEDTAPDFDTIYISILRLYRSFLGDSQYDSVAASNLPVACKRNDLLF